MTPDFRKVLDGWAWDDARAAASADYDDVLQRYGPAVADTLLRAGVRMNTSEEQFLDDERDHQAQQAIDDEARELRLIDILRRMAEGVPVSRDDVAIVAAGCGIDKRDVL